MAKKKAAKKKSAATAKSTKPASSAPSAPPDLSHTEPAVGRQCPWQDVYTGKKMSIKAAVLGTGILVAVDGCGVEYIPGGSLFTNRAGEVCIKT